MGRDWAGGFLFRGRFWGEGQEEKPAGFLEVEQELMSQESLDADMGKPSWQVLVDLIYKQIVLSM